MEAEIEHGMAQAFLLPPPAKDVAAAFAAGRVVHLDGRGATVAEALVRCRSGRDLVGGFVLVAVDASADAVVHELTLAGARSGSGRRHGTRVRALLLGRLRKRGESKQMPSAFYSCTDGARQQEMLSARRLTRQQDAPYRGRRITPAKGRAHLVAAARGRVEARGGAAGAVIVNEVSVVDLHAGNIADQNRCKDPNPGTETGAG